MFACCILHNICLHFDGLDSGWDHGVEWNSFGRHGDDDLAAEDLDIARPQQVVLRAGSVFRTRNANADDDFSSVGQRGRSAHEADLIEIEPSHAQLRGKLINHLFYLFRHSQLFWVPPMTARKNAIT